MLMPDAERFSSDFGLATRLQAERVARLLCLLDSRTTRLVGRATVKVSGAAVDERKRKPCRRSDLTQSVTKRQIHVSWACTKPPLPLSPSSLPAASLHRVHAD